MQGDGNPKNIRRGRNSVYVVISVCKRSNTTPSISPPFYFFPANISVKDDVTVIFLISFMRKNPLYVVSLVSQENAKKLWSKNTSFDQGYKGKILNDSCCTLHIINTLYRIRYI